MSKFGLLNHNTYGLTRRAITIMPTTESPPPPAGDQPSNWSLIARMIGLGWRYRRGCTYVVILHILVVGLSLSALGLTGVGIDLIGHHLAPETVPQKLPRLFIFAPDWSALQQLSLIAGLILGSRPPHDGRALSGSHLGRIAQPARPHPTAVRRLRQAAATEFSFLRPGTKQLDHQPGRRRRERRAAVRRRRDRQGAHGRPVAVRVRGLHAFHARATHDRLPGEFASSLVGGRPIFAKGAARVRQELASWSTAWC